MSTLKIEKKQIDIDNISNFEFVIKMLFPNFKKLNYEFFEITNDQIINSNVKFTKKTIKSWISKNIFKSCFSNKTRDFWKNRGYDDIETKMIISELQKNTSKLRTAKIIEMKKSGDNSWKKMFNVHLDYWLEKGYSEEEAKKMLSSRQTTFSLDKCITKFGEEKGTEIWKKRQEKWLSTLSSKAQEEKMDIKIKKVVPMGKASRESLRIFDPIAKYLVAQKYLDDSDIFYGYENRKEWYLSSSNEFYLYDFCIPKLKLIIEYQGKAFHPSKNLSKDELKEWKSAYGVLADDVINKDEKKKSFAETKGYKVLYLWSDDGFEFNFDKAKNAIFDALENISHERKISTIEHLIKKSDVLIESPSGYHPVINFVHKPNKNLLNIKLEDNFELTCSDDHLLFSDNKWILAKEIIENKDKLFKLSTEKGEKKVISISNIGVGYCVDITVECLENHYYSAGIASHNCGKTILALAAALEQIKGISVGENAIYNKLVVTRPIQPVGKELGFLPGTLEEKMDPWIAPIKDNFNYLIGGKKGNRQRKHSTGYDNKKVGKDDGSYLSLLQEKGLIEIEAITYIRGRSIPDSFIIIDEAQNLSVHELKTIITRVGDGTKIVLTGDLEQIDNIHVDAYTNGLSYAIEKFKNYPIAAHVTLLKGERSELATLASQIL